MITLNNIHVSFNQGTPLESHVLKGVNLTVEEGEFLTVIGTNGSGKSTLLNVISGDLIPDEGMVLIDDESVTRLPAYKRAHYVSRVFQNPLWGTCEGMTIEENLALAYRRGHSRGLAAAIDSKMRRRFKDVLAELKMGLEVRLKDPIGKLSGGQRQAVSLIMATLQPSRIILLDEHTAALDPKTAKLILGLTNKMIEKHSLTALMVTHSMHQALEFGSRTIVIHKGNIIQDLSSSERKAIEPHDLIDELEADDAVLGE